MTFPPMPEDPEFEQLHKDVLQLFQKRNVHPVHGLSVLLSCASSTAVLMGIAEPMFLKAATLGYQTASKAKSEIKKA